MLGGSGREHTPLGLSGSTISFPGRSRLVPGEAGLTAYAQLVLYGCTVALLARVFESNTLYSNADMNYF